MASKSVYAVNFRHSDEKSNKIYDVFKTRKDADKYVKWAGDYLAETTTGKVDHNPGVAIITFKDYMVSYWVTKESQDELGVEDFDLKVFKEE